MTLFLVLKQFLYHGHVIVFIYAVLAVTYSFSYFNNKNNAVEIIISYRAVC